MWVLRMRIKLKIKELASTKLATWFIAQMLLDELARTSGG